MVKQIKEQITFTLEDEEIARVRELAKKERRSIANFTRNLFLLRLEEYEKEVTDEYF